MVTRKELTKYGFVQASRDDRPFLCDDIEIWSHPKAVIAFFDPKEYPDLPIANSVDIKPLDLAKLAKSDWKPTLEQCLIGRFKLSPFYPKSTYMKD
ncbi:MAG: hypothetical protein KAS66_10505 [Candidatus Omnitrophica bacterium]|nr:hypothetical protein [Candidatus Omnitrophota bacterium]